MDIFIYCLNGIGPVILTVLCGYLLKHFNLLAEPVNAKINRLCFVVFLPVMIFNNIRNLNFFNEFDISFVGFCLSCVLSVFLILNIITPHFIKDRQECSAFIHGVFRGNFLQLGYPLAIRLFGSRGGTYAAMLLPFAVCIYNILAVLLLTYFNINGGFRKSKGSVVRQLCLDIIKNPLIIGALSGIVFSVFSINLPEFIDTAFQDIGDIGPALCLIMLGAQMAPMKTDGHSRVAFVAVFLRLVIVPIIMTVIGIIIGFRGVQLGTLFLLIGTSTAVTSHIMAVNMGSDHELTGKIIVISTICSAVTIFIGIYLLKLSRLI